MKKLFLLVTIVFFSLSAFSYENFRVHKTVFADMTDEISSIKAVLEVNDALVIKVPKEPVFLQGLSLEVKIPPEVAEFRDSVAYFLYTDVKPQPTEKTIDYQGNRIFINTFPTRLSCNLLIPLVDSVELKETPYSTVLPSAMSDKSGYVFFRLQLVMKGTPVNIWDSSFVIDIKPILADKGALELSVLAPELHSKENSYHKSEQTEDLQNTSTEVGKNDNTEGIKNEPNIINLDGTGLYTLYIDGELQKYPDQKIILSTGQHHLSVVSDVYRSEVRTIVVEQAQTTKLEILMKDVTPLVEVVAPEGIQVFLDSDELHNWQEPFTVSEGNHLLRFVLGGYEKIQSFEAFNGKTYKFSLNLDVNLVESE